MKAIYIHVAKRVFDKLCRELTKNESIKWNVDLRYNGGCYFGNVSIAEIPGFHKDYAHVLLIFQNLYYDSITK